MISFALLAVTLFRFFGQVYLELLPFIAECVTNIENKTNLTPLSEFCLSDARAHARRAGVPTKHATYQIVLPIIYLHCFKGKGSCGRVGLG